jgi:hypothetical protein
MLHTMLDRSGSAPLPLDDVGSTGIAELDDVLGGLFWGDNVVF